jgi:hypothetical protein
VRYSEVFNGFLWPGSMYNLYFILCGLNADGNDKALVQYLILILFDIVCLFPPLFFRACGRSGERTTLIP